MYDQMRHRHLRDAETDSLTLLPCSVVRDLPYANGASRRLCFWKSRWITLRTRHAEAQCDHHGA